MPGILAPVLLDVAVRVAVDRAQHGRPGVLEHQEAFLVVGDRLALLRRDVGLLAEEGPRARAGLERHATAVGVIMNMPVSVCHQVSMIGQRSLPITR